MEVKQNGWQSVALTYCHEDDILEASVDGRVVLRKYQRDGVIQIDEILEAAKSETLVDLTQQVVLSDFEAMGFAHLDKFFLPNCPLGPKPLTLRQRMTHQRTTPAYRQLVRGPKGKVSRW